MADSRPRNTALPVSDPTFASLGVPAPLVRVLADAGITEPFPIQTATLPDSMAGRDVLGRGRTGSGKTLAFAIPMLARLAAQPAQRRPGRPRALILAPTRELVTQIEAAMAPMAKVLGLSTLTIFGGVKPGGQISALRRGVDIVLACPGRLEDHLRSNHIDLGSVEITVLDEADHMADLGFLPGVKRLMDQTPKRGQRMLFSATLDRGVDVLVKRYLTNPVTHSVDSEQSPISTMTHHVLHVGKDSRIPVLVDLTSAPGRTVVFTRTKHGAKNLARQLNQKGVPAIELHGNLSQNARTRNMSAFSNGTATTLVATDIAARGIHVDDVNLVVHADPPVEHKAYLHRSGRTARAGNTGTVVTLMLDGQVSDVRDLTRRAGIKPTITRLGAGHPLLAEIAPGERKYVAAAEIAASLPKPERERPNGAARGRSGGGGGSRRRSGGGSNPASQSNGQPGGRRNGRSRPKAAAASSGGSHSAASFSSNRRGR
jgi:superfamily II DNA/RNA helicase